MTTEFEITFTAKITVQAENAPEALEEWQQLKLGPQLEEAEIVEWRARRLPPVTDDELYEFYSNPVNREPQGELHRLSTCPTCGHNRCNQGEHSL